MSPPRIVIVGPSADAQGGIAQFTQRLGEALAQQGSVSVVAFERLYPGWTHPGRGSSGVAPTVPQSIVRTTPWTPWTWRRARREVAESAPDLVVVQWWHPVFGPVMRSILRSANRAGARSVVICHNAEPHERFPFSRRLTSIALREASQIVTLSSGVTDKARILAPNAWLTELELPPILDIARVDRQRRPQGRPASLLFFGNVRPYKGLADLLEAIPAIRYRIPVKLTVAGRFLGSAPMYQRAIRRLGIEDIVELRDEYIPDAEVSSLLAAADLVVLPYREASQSGVVALAALAGTPVVATSAGGLQVSLGTNAIIVPPRDHRALGEGILRALRTPPPPPDPPRMGWEAFGTALLTCLHPNPSAAPA